MESLIKSSAEYLRATPARAAIFLIKLYQRILSPDHGILGIYGFNARCRFYPSCSEYTLDSVRQYGLLYGGVVSLKRILKCHPWSRGGYDPVNKTPNHKFQITNKF